LTRQSNVTDITAFTVFFTKYYWRKLTYAETIVKKILFEKKNTE